MPLKVRKHTLRLQKRKWRRKCADIVLSLYPWKSDGFGFQSLYSMAIKCVTLETAINWLWWSQSARNYLHIKSRKDGRKRDSAGLITTKRVPNPTASGPAILLGWFREQKQPPPSQPVYLASDRIPLHPTEIINLLISMPSLQPKTFPTRRHHFRWEKEAERKRRRQESAWDKNGKWSRKRIYNVNKSYLKVSLKFNLIITFLRATSGWMTGRLDWHTHTTEGYQLLHS